MGLLKQEEKFAAEFLIHDGLIQLIDIIRTSHGNTLAVGAPSANFFLLLIFFSMAWLQCKI
jgi:hypothetical protein